MLLWLIDDLIYIFVWFVIIARLVAIVVIVVILDLLVVIKVSTFIYDIHMLNQLQNDGGFHVCD